MNTKEVKTLELQINNDYRIRTDELNVMLEKRRVGKKGATEGIETWDIVGYYPEMRWAYNAMLKRSIHVSDLEGVQAIVTAIERVEMDIKESLSESNIRRLDKQMRKLAMENELLKKKLNKVEVQE
jgi:hypothetical protein